MSDPFSGESEYRRRVIEVFGDFCPVCGHSVTGAHNIWERCELCWTNCGSSPWPPESIERYQRYHNNTRPPARVKEQSMSRQIVTININGVSLAQFAADSFNLDITYDTVTMTCGVPNTQERPVTIDDLASALLNVKFSNSRGETVTLADLSAKPDNRQ